MSFRSVPSLTASPQLSFSSHRSHFRGRCGQRLCLRCARSGSLCGYSNGSLSDLLQLLFKTDAERIAGILTEAWNFTIAGRFVERDRLGLVHTGLKPDNGMS